MVARALAKQPLTEAAAFAGAQGASLIGCRADCLSAGLAGPQRHAAAIAALHR